MSAASPHGFCECGCGEKTRIAAVTHRQAGQVKGEPLRFVHGHNAKRTDPPYIEDENGCWIWRWARSGDGSGSIRVGGQQMGAHRFIYEMEREAIDDDLELHHICENRPCVNPDHLQPLTIPEHRAVTRMACGEQNSKSKLTAGAVRQIRAWLAGGWSQPEIARAFAVTQTTISAIKCGRTWRHVT